LLFIFQLLTFPKNIFYIIDGLLKPILLWPSSLSNNYSISSSSLSRVNYFLFFKGDSGSSCIAVSIKDPYLFIMLVTFLTYIRSVLLSKESL